MTLEKGTRLGPYEILAPLGQGGMGEVYRARDTRLAREVAVKVLPPSMASSREALERFEREARAVAALNHPNILALHDVGTEGGVSFAVTELLEGETLRERLAAGRLAPRKVIEVAVQLARGLAAAHERGIVHRDLKPENVFVTDAGHVKILDFGIARQDVGRDPGAETQSLTEPGVIWGTVGYMAPEQMRGEPAVAESDVFSLGVVCHEMLAGRAPFARATASETLAAVIRDDPPDLAALAPSLPAGLARIVRRCLEKRAADRPSSARDLAIYLDALGTEAPPAPGAAVHGAVPPDPRALRLRILAATAGLLLLLTACTWGYVQVMATRTVDAAVDADLARASVPVARVHADRLARLDFTARLVSSFPELKALFGTDAATVRDFLLSYQQRTPGTPTLVALAPSRQVLARTDTAAIGGAGDDNRALAALASSPGSTSVVRLGGALYHAAAAASEAAGAVFGFVIALSPVDEAFARQIAESTEDEVAVLGEGIAAVSTVRAGQLPWTSLAGWRAGGGSATATRDVRVGARHFAAREVPLSTSPELVAVVLKSRDEVIAPYRRIQNGLVLLGLAAFAASVAGSLWLTRFVLRAVAADQRL